MGSSSTATTAAQTTPDTPAYTITDQVAVVTGGARGIGREIALLLAKAGAHCVLFDVNEALLAETTRAIEALGRKSAGVPVDVTDFESVESAVNKTLDKFGHVDILINNAGITRDGLIMRMSPADWDLVLGVNLKGAFYCTKALTRSMMKQRGGSIVNIASIIGVMGNAGQANYAASKGGLIALTKSTAKELASRGVRANAIAPGFIQTEMTDALPDDVKAEMLRHIPLGTFGRPIDVAQAALFLVSDAARYITGQVLIVDGGMVMA